MQDWLAGLGLSRYWPAFAQADIGPDVLADLTQSDLAQLGVSLGDRKRLLRAIAQLTGGASAGGDLSIDRPAPGAERRQLTVMFCDLAGSTAIANAFDPEVLHAVIADFQACVAEAVDRYDGLIARYMGDGVLIYFGFPHAHEDDAERAVRAGLDIVAAAGRIRLPSGERAGLRIGIATGLVVVGEAIGEGASREQAVVGATPNLAARLQALAEPGSIVISAGTRRLLGERFVLRDLGRQPLKGFPEPVAAWAVAGVTRHAGTPDAAPPGPATRFVNRAEERIRLRRLWMRAQGGQGQVVIVSGEAGIGKSRLMRELYREAAQDGAAVLRFACTAFQVNSAFSPLIDFFDRELALMPGADERAVRLEALLDALPGQEAACPPADRRFIADLLGLLPPPDTSAAAMTPQRVKDETIRALVDLFAGIAARRPAVIAFSDLHWADPSTLDLLDRLVARAASCPMLLVLTHRPEFTPRWPQHAHVATLPLGRLSRTETATIVEALTAGKTLPPELVTDILGRADGIPLFVEELTRTVLDSGALIEGADRWEYAAGAASVPIPPTLRDSLTARLDRLGPLAKDVAHRAAAIGREFDLDLLAAIVQHPPAALRDALGRLCAAGILSVTAMPAGPRYRFRHALVQDAAYETILMSRRTALHAAIAEAIEQRFPEMATNVPETLARHHTAAGNAARAIPYWLAAGQAAAQRSAMAEAIARLNAGIALLGDLDAQSDARRRYEVLLHSALGFAWTATRGYAAPEVQAAFTRAQQWFPSDGDPALSIPVLRGFATYHWVLGNLPLARSYGNDLRHLADRGGDEELLLVAHGMLAGITHHLGDFATSELHLRHLRPESDWKRHRSIIARFGEATPTATYVYHAYNLAWLGHPRRAIVAADAAIASARRTEHPLSIANALSRAAACPVILRDAAAACAYAQEGMALAREYGFPIYMAMSAIVLGWAAALGGDPAGVAQMRASIDAWRASGAACGLPCYYSLLSEALLAQGDIDAALAAADDGRHWAERNSERSWDALLLCARGDALIAAGNPAAAEVDLAEALAWSRERGARWGELCAAVRLTRLWRASARPRAVPDLLGSLCAWFADAPDSAVLLEAAALRAAGGIAVAGDQDGGRSA